MDEIRNLIHQALDRTISPEDFQRLQDALEQNGEIRDEYLRAVSLSETLCELATEAATAEQTAHAPAVSRDGEQVTGSAGRPYSPGGLAIAASILLLVSGMAFWLGQQNISRQLEQQEVAQQAEGQSEESLIAGHATLRRTVDVAWSSNAADYREGDVLPDGLIRFEAGVAEIDFFSGATLIVEGPATLDIESDWVVKLVEGRLRAHVPPAARGFVVKAADSEIVDLGTEFALEVGDHSARVEVIDGEVELRGGAHDGSLLETGQRRWLKGSATDSGGISALSTVSDVSRRREDAETERFAEWQRSSHSLSQDDRLIAYYPIAAGQNGRRINEASAAGSSLDGLLVGPVDRVAGRFGPSSAGLEFDRPGARMRVRIDGEFRAFTFVCWARIDSLEHRYNALFMGDGYENGEPHWQIRDDGALMFSVMVDDTQDIQHFNKIDQRMVKAAGLHRVYYSKPFWDISKSGRWFHLAAVFDPAGRKVVQYVNGKQVGSEKISDRFHIATLRIGPAEIGNWGQPFRKTPWFAVRNLNGTVDELAIFEAALTHDEIQDLYQQGKPLGY